MDEFRSRLGLIGLCLITAACASEKTPETVMRSYEKMETCGGEVSGQRYIVQWESGAFSVEVAEDVENFKAGFVTQNLAAIKEIRPDLVFRRPKITAAESETGDSEDLWAQSLIGVEAAWAAGHKGQGVKVGVVDSFVDLAHEALEQQIAYNKFEIPDNDIDDDQNGYVDDYRGQDFVSLPSESKTKSAHGTHVAGVVVGAHYIGLAKGVAPEARLVAAPFINDDDSGYFGDAILALQYVVDRGAKVVNLSWGGKACEPSLKAVLETLGARGVLFTVAAGNGSPYRDNDLERDRYYPAAFALPTQITVAATSSFDILLDWSFYSHRLVNLAAPGEGILSAIPANRYRKMSGTSMASPFVAGAAAILWGAFPEASVQQVKSALLTGVDRPQLALAVSSGGRLNVQKALESLRALLTEAPAPTP